MLVLAVDAGTDTLSVAVGRPGMPKAVRSVAGARRHAGLLAQLASEALAEAGVTFGQIEALAVSDGPGSFTGLRVAAAWAKGLARPAAIPLWTASTLLVRALTAAAPGRTVLAASSALRGEWFVAIYRFDADRIAELVEPIVAGAGWAPPPGIVVDAVVADSGSIGATPSWLGAPVRIEPPGGLPSADRLIDLIGRDGGARRINEPADWEPTYGRPAEAQAKWEREHGRPLSNPGGGIG